MFRLRLWLLLPLVCLWCVSGGGEASAQAAAEAAKLEELRQGFFKENAAATAPLTRRYRNDLLALERQCAARRDYVMAAKVRDERLKAEQKLAEVARLAPQVVAARPYLGGPVTLGAKDATVAGGVIFNRARDVLEGWQFKDAAARWELPFPLPAGGYQVVLELACAPGSGGQVEIKEEFHTLKRDIAPTGGWSEFSSRSLGTLRLRANATNLRITATEVAGEGLFLLRAITLIPVAEAAP